MIMERGKLYIFTKSGNEVRTISRDEPWLKKPCWLVERTQGKSVGKRMIVLERTLVAREVFEAE